MFFMPNRLLIALIFMITCISVETQAQISDDAQLLRDLLTSPNCNIACYKGLEPLVTTLSDLELFFNNNNLDAEWVTSGESFGFYYWTPSNVPFYVSTRGRLGAAFSNGVLVQMDIPLDISTSTIIEAFGEPDDIKEEDEGAIYHMIYENEGLLFLYNTRFSTDQSVFVFLSNPQSQGTLLTNDRGREPIEQTCTTYGAPPCIAATAEPNQFPVADAGTNAQSQPGYLCHVVAATDTCQFQLDASSSSDIDGTLVAYQWAYRPLGTSDWLPIDPNVTEYTSPTVFFSPTPGDYEVRVRVRDDDFAEAEAVTSMVVNRRPAIVIDPTLPVCTVDSAGQSCTVTVDAGQSFDPDGTVERYLWYVRLPDGSQPILGETTAADPTWDYTLQSGQHNLVLRIIDNDGGTRGKLFQAIANIRPVADAGADQDVYVWPANPRTGASPYSAPITLDGTDSSDPDGIIFTYEWYRIQNNLSTGTETRSSIGNGATLQYNAGVIGCVQTIELVVTDNHAATHADRMSVDVSGDGAWTPPGGCGGVFTR
jgi:hypothetical protein